MKKLKLVMAIAAVFMVSNPGFGANPTKKDYTKNLAENIVKCLCNDIQLSDSQKQVIQTIAKEYEIKMKNTSLQPNSESKKANKKQAVLQYRTTLNQILTKEQIDTLKIKRIERLESALNK